MKNDAIQILQGVIDQTWFLNSLQDLQNNVPNTCTQLRWISQHFKSIIHPRTSEKISTSPHLMTIVSVLKKMEFSTFSRCASTTAAGHIAGFPTRAKRENRNSATTGCWLLTLAPQKGWFRSSGQKNWKTHQLLGGCFNWFETSYIRQIGSSPEVGVITTYCWWKKSCTSW